MDEEFNIISRSHVITAIVVVAFGWGSIWAGLKGMSIVLGNNHSNLAQVSDGADEVLPGRSPTPSPSEGAKTTVSPSPAPQKQTGTFLPTQVMPTYSNYSGSSGYSGFSSYGTTFAPVNNPPTQVDYSPFGQTADSLNSILPKTQGLKPKTSDTTGTNPLLPDAVFKNSHSQNSYTILVAGDTMFDRGVRQIGQKSGYGVFFSDLTALLAKADTIAVNLVGPITSKPSKTLVNGRTTKSKLFTFPSYTALILARLGINAVSLANNHVNDFGQPGLTETRKSLAAAAVSAFGDNKNASSTAYINSPNGFNIAFIGYNSSDKNFDATIKQVRDAFAVGKFVIVMPHCDDDKPGTSTKSMTSQARQLVSAGASAIIGACSHVVLDHEWMGSVPVFYSLGNFLFDDHSSKAVENGQIVELNLTRSIQKVFLSSVTIFDISNPTGKIINLVSPIGNRLTP